MYTREFGVRWVDELLKIHMLTLQYARTGRAKNANNMKGMLFLIYSIFCLIVYFLVCH